MRRLILGIFLLFSCNLLSQEVQFKSTDVVIGSDTCDISPTVEIFKINLTDYIFVYTIMKDGLILYSKKSNILEYTVNNGIVKFKTNNFNFELHINSNNCELIDLDDTTLKWLGDCCIDFSIMLR